jgi:hypothetical protein
MTTVWIYVDTNKEVGDRDHLKVFANRDAADEWLKDNDPEGIPFGYEVDGKAKRERPIMARRDLARGRGSSRE